MSLRNLYRAVLWRDFLLEANGLNLRSTHRATHPPPCPSKMQHNVSKAKLLKRVYLTTLILRHFRAWDKVTESGQRVTVRADRASSARLKAKRDRLFRCCCLALLLFMVLLCGA